MTTDPRVKNLRDAQRRLRSALVANADRLDKPFTDAPDKNPWDTFVRPAMRGLEAAVDAIAATPAAPVTVPPADQPGLRDRIADVLADADGWKWAPGYDKTKSPAYRGYRKRADAVLAVLPAPVDRGVALREAANWFEAGGRSVETLFGHQVAAQLRRLADATPVAAPDAAPNGTGAGVAASGDEARQQNDGDRRVYAWAQTIDTADSGRTVHIPGVHHGGDGAETVAIVVGREDVPVLAAMLASGTPQPETQAAEDSP